MSRAVEIVRHAGVAVVSMNHPPVNALSADLRVALFDALIALRDDPEVLGIVLVGSGRCFSAGADIDEFRGQGADAIARGRDPSDIGALIDESAKPVVAALHGVAFGGGLELALACHARVAEADAQMGLPEITLGLLPGAGGTQRLPRLIGMEPAADMILSGRAIGAREALQLGLIDTIADGDLEAIAKQHVATLLAGAAAPFRARDRVPPPLPADRLASIAAIALSRRTTGFAAKRIVECLQAVSTLSFDEGLRLERSAFLACNASAEAAALQHGFAAIRHASKLPALAADAAARSIERVAVVGGGTMGRGIAMAFANAGLPVTVIETDDERAHAAFDAMTADYRRLVESGRLPLDEGNRRTARLSARASKAADEAIAQSDLVIEAVFEDLEVKMAVCRRLGELCKPGAIIATNTSTLDVDVLARASGRPADVVGLHFFSPAHVMKLLEVVRGEQTATDVLVTAMALARRLGKHAVVSGVCYGFIGNRMLEPYLREAEALLLEGAAPRQIDRALESFGMAMGPCRMMDMAGVDVVAKVVEARARANALPDDPLYRIVCRELASRGWSGQKTSQGFYRYDGRKALDDLAAVEAIGSLARARGVARRTDIGDVEIVERCLFPLYNEGFRVVEEGIAYRSSDVDVVWLSGYGFPAERGGPMFDARQMGTTLLCERLLHYAETRGDAYGYWQPALSLQQEAGDGPTGTNIAGEMQ